MTELRTDKMFLNFVEQANKLKDEDYQSSRALSSDESQKDEIILEVEDTEN